MCLNVYDWATREFRATHPEPGATVPVWKVIAVEDGDCLSPYQRTPISPGTLRSDRRKRDLTESETQTGEVCEGIHVLRSEGHAVALAKWLNKRHAPGQHSCHVYHVIACTARAADLVAVGDNGDAVFMEIFIPVEVLARAIQEHEILDKADQYHAVSGHI